MYKLTYDGDPNLFIEVDVKNVNELILNTNGSFVKKLKKREFAFNDTNGNPLSLIYRPGVFRKTFLINKEIVYKDPHPPLSEYIAFGFPFILVFIGGAIGGAIGFGFAMLSLKLSKKTKNHALKILSGIVMAVAAFIVYSIVVFLIFELFGKQ